MKASPTTFTFNLLLILASLAHVDARSVKRVTSDQCQVVIVGGSTAALAAALSSSAFVKTCLLEPTDWPGGQFTASGLPAPDFAWQTIKNPATNATENVAAIDRAKANVTPNLWHVLQSIGNPGACWVSPYCGTARQYLQAFETLIDKAGPNLQIFTNTVLKNVSTGPARDRGSVIVSLTAIQRTARDTTACGGYDKFLSEDLADCLDDSPRYTKQRIDFVARDAPLIVMDASEWGEVLALSEAPYLQGVDERFDGDTSGQGNDTCGQSSTFAVSAKLFPSPVTEPDNPYPDHWSQHYFSLTGHSWDAVWTYRRMSAATHDTQHAATGDVTLQNWNPGNDNAFVYLFLTRNDTRQQRADWQGGVNVQSLQTAEYMAYAWHYWFKAQAPSETRARIKMVTDQFGTCHGLSKVPYIRDTRRSIGLDNFVMKVSDITGLPEQQVGYPYFDRVALGSYPVDVHGLQGCQYPRYMQPSRYQVLPFYVPVRALTNARYSNLLVAGKTMATSFLTNAGARLHPIEWSSGTAAGVSASIMAQLNIDSTALVRDHIRQLQQVSAQFTPNCWTINGVCY